MPVVLQLINKAKIDSALYFSICLQMIGTVERFQLNECFRYIDISLLSEEQYYRLVRALIKASPKKHNDVLPVINGEKLGNKCIYALRL